MALELGVEVAPGVSTILEAWGDGGPVILCVHGITSSRRSWARLGERLASRFQVFAYDQRGHGDAAAAPGPMSLERSVADLSAVVAAVGRPIDVLVGHSWGGAVAVLGGRELRPHKVLAIDPMLRVPANTFEAEYVDDLRATLSLAAPERTQAIKEMYAGAHFSDVDGKLHAMLPMSIGSLERLGRDNRVDAGGWDVRETLANYPVPLRILAAGQESVLSADDLAFVRERGGPAVTVRIFPSEGHNLQRTAFDEFVEELSAFAS